MLPPSCQPGLQALEGASLSALGAAANLTKCFLVFANREARSAAAAAGAACQVPRGNPGVCQVSSSALEKWPVTQMHVAQSMEWRGVPHGGKIMIVLVFMGHYITSAGGSVVAVAFRGYVRLQRAHSFFLSEEFFCLFPLLSWNLIIIHGFAQALG